MTVECQLEISRVGAQGDGVVEGTKPLFVPYTLPGEHILAYMHGGRAELLSVVTPSSDRVAPVCKHFGTCGGCALQHWASEPYAKWKRDQVIAAFSARGLDVAVSDLVQPGGRRRRATLSAKRCERGLQLGFHKAQSHELVDLHECPVLDLRIVSALPDLKTLIDPLISKHGEARLVVTMTAAGLDIAIEGIEKTLSSQIRSVIAKSATASGFARVSIEGDPVYEALPPFLMFGSTEVRIPPGLFIQAVAEAEKVMAALILAGVGKVKTVADLFSGAGAFTFPIAARAKVLAVDSDKTAIAALAAGVKKATGIKPITTLVRDLLGEPLSPLELNEHDAIVFDPPRAGAEAQATRIAKSKVKTVVAVSCNPATLARDARILIDGGYKLETVTPVDQFHYSPHIEVVAVFRR